MRAPLLIVGQGLAGTVLGHACERAGIAFEMADGGHATALRRSQTRSAGEMHIQLLREELDAEAEDTRMIPDRRLALMFACAHPQIEPGLRAPLILQTILGLTAVDIAAAFLIPPATMGQRLVRAKARIKETGIPFAIPEREDLPERLDAVLEAIYAAYTKGWAEIGERAADRLADEAIWLGRLVASLLPDEPEAKGLLALMLYAEARRDARRDHAAYVPLQSQDVALWNREHIVAAEALLHAANQAGPTGRYQIEAAIQSAHIARRVSGQDNWPAIVALYDVLLELTRSPVVRLNRAAALAETAGPAAALASLEGIGADRRMQQYQPYWATRVHLCASANRKAEAHEAFTLAIGLAIDPAVRRYLAEQRLKLADG